MAGYKETRHNMYRDQSPLVLISLILLVVVPVGSLTASSVLTVNTIDRTGNKLEGLWKESVGGIMLAL
jgi:hypothetical protein